MARDETLAKCIEAVAPTLGENESIVQIRRGQPEFVSHADYFTRYKVDIATLNGSGTEISNRRCVVVKISSNFGTATIDASRTCETVPDVTGL